MRERGFRNPEVYRLDPDQYMDFLNAYSDDIEQAFASLEESMNDLLSGEPIEFLYEDLSETLGESGETIISVMLGNLGHSHNAVEEGSELWEFAQEVRGGDEELDEVYYDAHSASIVQAEA